MAFYDRNEWDKYFLLLFQIVGIYLTDPNRSIIYHFRDKFDLIHFQREEKSLCTMVSRKS